MEREMERFEHHCECCGALIGIMSRKAARIYGPECDDCRNYVDSENIYGSASIQQSIEEDRR